MNDAAATTNPLHAVEVLDLRLRWADSCWTVECRALKATGVGPIVKAAAKDAWSKLDGYHAALEAMPDKALKAPALRERDLLRALRSALVELGAEIGGGS